MAVTLCPKQCIFAPGFLDNKLLSVLSGLVGVGQWNLDNVNAGGGKGLF